LPAGNAAAALTASVDVVPVTLAGFGVTVRPLAALTARFTGSANPLILESVRVALALAPPACTLTGTGETDSAIAGSVELNVAVMVLPKSFGVNVQVSAVPVHKPAQLVNALPAAGAAVSVICVNASNWLLQVPPQLMPAGLDVTVPVPEPAFNTATPGRPFRTARLIDGVVPLRPSVSWPTKGTRLGCSLVTMSASLAAAIVTVVEETPGASEGGSNAAVRPLDKNGMTKVTVAP